MKDLFTLAPKRFLRFLTESASYTVGTFFKYWLVSVIAFSILILIAYKYISTPLTTKQWALLVASSFIIVAVPVTIYRFYKETYPVVYGSGFPVGITETVMIEGKEHLALNTDSQKIIQKLKNSITAIASVKYPFCKGLVIPLLLQKPKLFYLSHNLTTWRGTLVKQVKKGFPLSVLMITRDTQSNKVDFEVLCCPGLMNSEVPFSEFNKSFTSVVSDDFYEDYIIEVSRVYLAIHGQSILDLLISGGDYAIAHQVIDDCEGIFREAYTKLSEILRGKENNHFTAFKNNLLSNFERYRGIIFLNQGKYSGAIRHVFKAIRLHPYFPYKNYEQYKDAFNKIYIAQVNLKSSTILLEGEMTKEDKEEESKKRITNSIELLARTDFSSTPPFEEVLKQIIARADSKQVYKEMEKVLKTNFCESPVCSIIRGEVLKYIPKGKVMHQSLYVERLPEVLAEFEKVLLADEDFLLMYTRIGVLKTIKSFYEKNSAKAEGLLHEGMKLFAKGSDVYSRLAMH